MRASGILMPIASLPGPYGIGNFSKEAYKFVDFLKASGQHYWQILPLGPTGYGDSPYQSFSTFAVNPYFIDLEELVEQKLLTGKECAECFWGADEEAIDYKAIYQERYILLRKAFERSNKENDSKFLKFCQEEQDWLEDYALFMAVKNHFGGISWDLWEEDIRMRKASALDQYRVTCEQDIQFYKYLQYLVFGQWRKLKNYANQKGILIIGDIPIYVAFDSVDTWANPELFQFDENRKPEAVAGCPPDGFSKTGQLWGNPLYRWEYHKESEYQWWISRMEYCFKLYDIVRVDHFRGFDEYYSIPFGHETAEFGHWKKGPGLDFFQKLEEKLGRLNIIAEDLGFLTDSVRKLVDDTGYPGMKVLQFGFDTREAGDYRPHNYTNNCVVYTGTHDNDTTRGWYHNTPIEDRVVSQEYLGNYRTPEEEIHWDFIRTALASVADMAIIPLQDYLGLGSEARINTPSTLGNNWKWRIKSDVLTKELADKIYNLMVIYGRNIR